MKKIIGKIFKSWISYACYSFLLLFYSCSDPGDCLKSTGTIIQQERTLAPFTGVKTEDNINIVFTNDSGSTVTVEAGSHIISKIKTEVEGGVLILSNDNTCNWVRSYHKQINVYIGIKEVKDIFHYGYGNISGNNLKKDTLFIHHYSNGLINLNLTSKMIWTDMDHFGDLKLSGSTNQLLAYSLNVGELQAQDFTADTIYLNDSGQGRCNVRAISSLNVSIKNEGSVYYYGTPINIVLEKQGSGNLIKGD
jgi:hypothetical protein